MSMHPTRYQMLDGWRGMASLVVVFHHVTGVEIGHWAVMVFFVISGYCISASAYSCLNKGMGFGQYLWRRIRRIYPPYAFAILYYFITRIVKLVILNKNSFGDITMIKLLQNMSMTQWLTLIQSPKPFAADNPSNLVAAYWSLNYEEQFYLVVAIMMSLSLLYGCRLTKLLLSMTIAALVWVLLYGKLCHGIFLEYWFLFGIGILVYLRLCRVHIAWQRYAIDLFIAMIIIISAAIVLSAQETMGRPRYSEMIVVGIFALILIYLRRFDDVISSSLFGKTIISLGIVTYSLYLIHQCNLVFAHTLISTILASSTPKWICFIGEIGIHVAIATVFWRICERPFLNKPVSL